MTIEEWNQLKPGDYIRPIRCPDLIYKVAALTADEDWSDKDDDGPIITHQIWTIDPFNSRDICAYDPGECGDYERCQPPKEKPVGGLTTR